MHKRLLVVEDDSVALRLLQSVLAGQNYEVTLAENGKQALELFEESPFPVVLSDLRMPEMDGHELISRLRKTAQNPVIIVQSAVQEIADVINVMKQGVFDYVIKPINRDEILLKVEKAFEVWHLRSMEAAVERERDIRLSRQMQNHVAVDRIVNRDYDKFDKELFSNLRTSFSQGAGFGGLLALVSLVSQSAKKQDEKYIIDASIMDLVIENAQMGEKALGAFQEIDDLLNMNLELTVSPLQEMVKDIKDVAQDLSDKVNLKNQKFVISEISSNAENREIKYNSKFMKKAISELFVNALKFSQDGSSIMVLMSVSREQFNLSILSNPVKGETTGIPPEYERIIFEPFFRLVKTVDERYDTLEFGLGLTMVDKILRKQNTKIHISNVESHLSIGQSTTIQVNAELEIPLLK